MAPKRRVINHGQKFGRLTVIREVAKRVMPNGMMGCRQFLCKCSCNGNVKVYGMDCLVRKTRPTQSCGCFQKECASADHSTHGLTQHPLYDVWRQMNRRCNVPEDKQFVNYGGRGIKVCWAWHWSNPDGMKNFVAWNDSILPGYEWQPGLEIDRCDNNGNYEPGNCRWATQTEQTRNRRITVNRNIHGTVLPIAYIYDVWNESGRICEGVTYDIFRKRVTRSKWSISKAAKTPIDKSKIR